MAQQGSQGSETSLRQLGRLIGVSDTAIRKARRRGVFSAEAVGVDASGAPTVLDLGLAVAEWERSGRRLRGSRGPAPPAADAAPLLPETPRETPPAIATPEPVEPLLSDEPAAPAPVLPPAPGSAEPRNLVDAQRMAMIERARKLRLENDQREGKLLDATQASREAFEFARVLRESLLNVPARLSAELAAETDAARVFARLDAALREALETTAATLERAVNE